MPLTEHCKIRRHGMSTQVHCHGPLARRVLLATIPATGREPEAGRSNSWRVWTHRINVLADAMRAAGVEVIDEQLQGRSR